VAWLPSSLLILLYLHSTPLVSEAGHEPNLKFPLVCA
jgi:hypothetical protein